MDVRLDELLGQSGICARGVVHGGDGEIRLRSGHRLSGLTAAEILVADDAGPRWTSLDALEPGGYVAVRYGGWLWPTEAPRLDGFAPSPAYGRQKSIQIPDRLDDDLALLLGMYVAEGSSVASNWTVSITNADSGVRELTARLIREKFGTEPFIQIGYGRCGSTRLASKRFIEWLDFVGAGRTAYKKRIPRAVLAAPRSSVLAFIQGLGLDGYSTQVGYSPRWAICVASSGLLDDLQILLTRLSIVHSRIEKLNKDNGKTYGEVFVSGGSALELLRLAPFLEVKKVASASRLMQLHPRGGAADQVPGINGRDLYYAIPRGKFGRHGYGHRSKFTHLLDTRSVRVSRRSLERVALIPGVAMPAWGETVLTAHLHFSPLRLLRQPGPWRIDEREDHS
ncbi:hypothetical protein [Egicoccus sp. AB-alg6-2]|uniref:hypothetical protein n=1 Tax=Egicoccus sp. AB-alg6-2 TaxID=3242692 RepID=UPI00359E21BB